MANDEGRPLKPHVLDLDKLGLHSPPGEFTAAMKKATEAMKPFNDQMAEAARKLAATPGFEAISKQLADQREAISKLRGIGGLSAPRDEVSQPRISINEIVQNPIVETNKRLGRIEEQFRQLQSIADRAANIATDIQTNAAAFLVDFKAASAENGQAASKAIRTGKIAIYIAVLLSLVPIAHTEFWRSPADQAETQQTIADLKREIFALREVQAAAAERIAAALEGSGQQNIEALRQIQRLLEKPAAAVPTAPVLPNQMPLSETITKPLE